MGEILLETPTELRGAHAQVALFDTSLADAPAQVLAETVFEVNGKAVKRIPFRLELRVPINPRARCTLAAEIRRHGGATIQPGDFVSVESVPWPPVGVAEPVRVPVRRAD